jgi:hypothetical protein
MNPVSLSAFSSIRRQSVCAGTREREIRPAASACRSEVPSSSSETRLIDKSDRFRKAKDLGKEELERAKRDAGDDLEAMSTEL